VDDFNVTSPLEIDWRPPPFETPRLVLRAFEASDAPAVFAYARNPNVTRFTIFPHHQTIDDSRHFVEKYARACYAERVAEPMAIIEKASGRLIGSAGVFWSSRPNGVLEIGYALGEPDWGQGYAAEACRPLIRHAFDEHDAARLQARVIEGNERSIRVLRKLSFRWEGTLRSALFHHGMYRNIEMFALLRDEAGEALDRAEEDARA
jgi:[ribosomal protein S5]-alanine N-acetyltransferase